VVPLAQNRRVVAIAEGDATLSFQIDSAIPMVQTSDIRWYYAANTQGGEPDFTSEDFQDITDLMNRTSVSSLDLSPDRLTLRISNIVQAIGEADQGRYFLSATNPAGERSSYIDVLVRGMIKALYPHTTPGFMQKFWVAINNPYPADIIFKFFLS